jgi:hypothetical protein
MDAVALLHRARKVGLRVEPMGDKLLVRGPKRAEAVVKLLEAHKVEVLAALAQARLHPSAATKRPRWMARKRADGAISSRLGSLTGSTVIVDGRRLSGSPGVTWKTNGTTSTVSAGPHGNAPDVKS